MQKEEKKISKELVTLAPKVNCKAFLVFLLKHLSIFVLYLCWKLSCYDKKKWCTTWESWLRCQMSTGLENDVINTRGIGHAVSVAVAQVLWCFVVYLQQIGKLLFIWTDNQPTEVPTWRSDATCKRTSEGSIILLLLLQEIASTCFQQKENYSTFQPRPLEPKHWNLGEVWIHILPVFPWFVFLHCKQE